MGRRDPYRDRPYLIGDERVDKISDDWRIWITCRRCGHGGHINYLGKFAASKGIKTADEFKARLVCEACRARDFTFGVEFVGKRRD